MKSVNRLTLTVLLFSLFALSGCGSVGPTTVTRDRFDYTAGSEPVAAQVKPSKPQPPKKHYQAARAAVMERNMDKANLEVKLALQDNPLDAASHFLLGCLLEQKGEHDQAIVAFQRASALDPTNPEALYNLGTMLLLRGEVLPASRMLEKAVLIRPDNAPSYNNLAKAYFLAGLPELAVAAYEEALRRDPSNAIALKNLLLLAEAARMDAAAATYRRRLEALGSRRAAKPIIDGVEPVTLLPTWPLATASAGSPTPTPSPVIPVPKPQAPPDKEADAFRELLRDLPHVAVERRAGRLTLTGWTRDQKERAMLGRILAGRSEVLDLTTEDNGDPQRMIEFDAVLFILTGLDDKNVGFNFLRLIDVNFNYFASDNNRPGTGFTAPPDLTGAVNGLSQWGWIFSAAASYSVNIANASTERILVLARPHLTTLSGTPATFLAGGELVYRVSGNISGDIKPYPFGTTLTVTPTLLRTPAEDGTPRVHVRVEAGRTSVLTLLTALQDPDQPTPFTKVTVASEAVLSLGQTLILSGLSQRESQTHRSGVPILMDIPILKYLVSTKTTVQADSAVIILLTPRDPAFRDERNQKALAEFVERRRAFLQARQGTEEDMRRFRERYPDWYQLPPNRFGSHFFLMENSEIYRAASGENLVSEDLDLELLGPKPNK
jgi:tetratricopeptide (TPR) repeat protein